MNENSPLNSFLENWASYVRQYTEAYRRAQEGVARLEPTIRMAAELANKAVENVPYVLLRGSVTFGRGGWSEIPLGEMDLSESSELVDRLYDKPDEEVRRELDQAIPEYFRRDDYAPLSEMVASWHDEHFEERHHIFEDALWAHKQGRYTLSIPALAVQIEGIVRSLTSEDEPGNAWIKRFNEAFDFDYKHGDYKRGNPPQPPDPEQVMSEFMTLSTNQRYQKVEELKTIYSLFRINELYDHGKFSDPVFTSSVK